MADGLFSGYDVRGFFDEAFDSSAKPRGHHGRLIEHFNRLGMAELDRRRQLGDDVFNSRGITFTVYGDVLEDNVRNPSGISYVVDDFALHAQYVLPSETTP